MTWHELFQMERTLIRQNKDPDVDSIITDREAGRRVSEFTLVAQIDNKTSEEEEE